MSIAQLKRRTDALQKKAGPMGTRSFTLEGLHRLLWQQDKSSYLKLAREGHSSVRVHQEQFEREDADRALRPGHRIQARIQ